MMIRTGLVVALACGVLEAQTAHEKLIPTLWTQTSVEWRASCVQAYRTAERMLDKAKRDKSWTAAVEQTGKFRKLPPAVILDIDETVLDNAPGQARQVRKGSDFIPADFSAWVMEAKAEAIPGAAGFCRYAHERGVRVFYVTNREAKEEAATRANLTRLGFPVDAREDAVLCRGEKPEWNTSDKTARRKELASRHRILLLIGDDFGDFLGGVRVSIPRRKELAAPYESYWGTRWIVLPNPSYGSWEQALFPDGAPKDPAERLKAKIELTQP